VLSNSFIFYLYTFENFFAQQSNAVLMVPVKLTLSNLEHELRSGFDDEC